MEIIWNIVNREGDTDRKKVRRFLFLNTVFWALIGFAAWGVVHFFALDTVGWALSFIGYAGYFIGWLGGAVFLWRR